MRSNVRHSNQFINFSSFTFSCSFFVQKVKNTCEFLQIIMFFRRRFLVDEKNCLIFQQVHSKQIRRESRTFRVAEETIQPAAAGQ